MKAIWDAYVALYNWQTGIPIAFNAAIAIAVIVYIFSSTYERLKHSIIWGCKGFVLAYAFVWLLIGSKWNIHAMWWINEISRVQVAAIIALIIGFIVGTIVGKDEGGGAGFAGGCVSFIVLRLFLLWIFASGDIFFLGIYYILYITALIGLPTLSIVTAFFIYKKLKHPGAPLIVFCYLNFSSCVALMYLHSLTMASYLALFLFLIGPFILMMIIFHFRQTIGTWVGGICCLFIITSIQLIIVMSPLHDKMQNVFSKSNLILILVVYAVFSASLVSYYLWILYRKRVEKKVENLHPILAIGAVVFNVCFLYPVVVSSKPWLWGAWFAGINLLIGLIILFGRLKVLSR
jgi:hypothetical protein